MWQHEMGWSIHNIFSGFSERIEKKKNLTLASSASWNNLWECQDKRG